MFHSLLNLDGFIIHEEKAKLNNTIKVLCRFIKKSDKNKLPCKLTSFYHKKAGLARQFILFQVVSGEKRQSRIIPFSAQIFLVSSSQSET